MEFHRPRRVMIKRVGRNYKFLSITTVDDRLLFHVPINRRNELFERFSKTTNVYLPQNENDKNQIDILLDEIESLDSIKELIDIAYRESE